MTAINLDLFDLHPAPTLVSDAASLQLLKVSRAAAEALNMPAQSLASLALTDLTPREAVPVFEQQAFAQATPASRLLMHLEPPGQPARTVRSLWLPATLDGRQVLVVTWEDSAPRDAAQSLAQNLQDTLDSIQDPLFIIGDSGDILFLNGAAKTLCEENTGPGASLWTQLRSDSRDTLQAACERSAKAASTRTTEELVLDDRALEVNCYPTENGLVVYLREITQQRAMEERLRQARKMEAVGQLTGGVAHDFNNLLTVIIGNADLLTEMLADNADLKGLAEMTGSAAQRGAELTHRLLAFSRRQALEPVQVDVNRLLASVDGLLRRTLEEHIDIELIRGAGLWIAEVDPGQLEVALLNLALNARDAMPGGGRLTVETANVTFDDNYAGMHDEVLTGQYVLISLSDTGTGIAADMLQQVFEPFFTTKKGGRGSGLGLSMVYGFAKQSGGHVNIYSEPDEGTTVKLYLPRGYGKNAMPESQSGRDETLGGAEHILVVEDDELVREHLCRQLRDLGYRVTAASHGAAALEEVRRHDDIDLLFTDVVMPGGMNGRELAESVSALRPDLKVLYTSGYTENAIVHQGRLDPGVELLSKPYRRRDLAAKVRKVLDA